MLALQINSTDVFGVAYVLYRVAVKQDQCSIMAWLNQPYAIVGVQHLGGVVSGGLQCDGRGTPAFTHSFISC